MLHASDRYLEHTELHFRTGSKRGNGKLGNQEFWQLLSTARKHSLTSEGICSGLAATGIHPRCPEMVIQETYTLVTSNAIRTPPHVRVYTRFLLLSPYLMFSSFSLLRLWFCYYYTISFFLILLGYGYHAFRLFIVVFLCYMIHSSMFILHPVYESCFTSARSLFSHHTYHICIRLVVHICRG